MTKGSENIARLGAAVLALATATELRAATLYTTNFSGTTNGNLVTDATTGQAGFVQTGTGATAGINPIQVVDGVVALGATGQDVSAAFSPPVTDGGSAYISTLATIKTATATGDYFVHLANTNSGVSFQSRLFAKASGTGYVLGFQASSSGVVYGTTELPLNTPVRIVTRYDVVAGAANDIGYIYVSPASSTEAANTPYLVGTTFTAAENTQSLGAVNLRQGGTNSGPTVNIDDLTVATTFAEALTPGPVPEPTSLALLGGAGAFALRRRRRI